MTAWLLPAIALSGIVTLIIYWVFTGRWTPFVFLLALLAGCASAPVVTPPDLDPAQWETVEALRLPVKQRDVLEDGGVGQIRVEIVEDLPGKVLGQAHRDITKPCRPWVEIERGAPATVLAHEIGHALLAMHSPDAPSGFMAPETWGKNLEITEEQRYLMQLGAQALKLCRRLHERKRRKTVPPAPSASPGSPSSPGAVPGGGAVTLTGGP